MNLRLEDIKYEREIAQAINKTGETIKTFSVENYLCPLGIDKKLGKTNLTSPLKLFTPSSTFHFTVVEKTEKKKKFAWANVPITELAKIDRRTQIATEKIIESENQPTTAIKEKEAEGTAYTQIIRVGKFKGQTPAQILQETDNRNSLEETMLWLEEKNFPGNKEQATAIREALELFDSGHLELKKTPQSTPISIYKADYRPLKSTMRKDGKMMMYTLSVVCYPSDNMPYEVKITNTWAKFNDLQMVEGTASEKVKTSIRLTETEWDDAVESMIRTKRIHENIYGKYELENSLESQKRKADIQNNQSTFYDNSMYREKA